MTKKKAKKKIQTKQIKKKDSGKREVAIVNIVVSTSLEHDIPLEKMAATLSNTEYNPEQFPGLVIRIKDPKTSALIFSSGKVVCTGARNLPDVEKSIKKIIKSLEKIDKINLNLIHLNMNNPNVIKNKINPNMNQNKIIINMNKNKINLIKNKD